MGGRHLSLFVQVASAKVSEVHGTQGPGWVFGHETGTGNRNINRGKKKGKAHEYASEFVLIYFVGEEFCWFASPIAGTFESKVG